MASGRRLSTRAEWAGPAGLGGARGVSGRAGCGRRRGRRGPGDGRSPSRLCWWLLPLPDPERPPPFPRVAASQRGVMLGKGVVGGGCGTKAPKPSFVSYVRPEVSGCRAGGASVWSGRSKGPREPLPRCREGVGASCPRAAGEPGGVKPTRARWGLPWAGVGTRDAGRQVSERRARLADDQVKRPELGRYCGPGRPWVNWRGARVLGTAEGEGLGSPDLRRACLEPAARVDLPCSCNFSVSLRARLSQLPVSKSAI